jgi:hypothetical protein
MWSVELPLAPGSYTYSFLIDGKEWKADPASPSAVGDDFGIPTSIKTVAPKGMST